MGDFILIDGDTATFNQAFGPAVVKVQDGVMKGSGPGTVEGKKLCVAGDEEGLSVPNCSYMTVTHPIAGHGTLKISALAVDQTAQKTATGGKLVLLKGSTFQAEFEVMAPAKQPSPSGGPPNPDLTRTYVGTGKFNTKNTLFRGS
jgi:hypothetical protein